MENKDEFDRFLIFSMLGLEYDPKKVKDVRSWAAPHLPQYIYYESKSGKRKKKPAGPYISIDFHLFEGYFLYLEELRKNPLYIDWDLFSTTLRVRFRYPPNEQKK